MGFISSQLLKVCVSPSASPAANLTSYLIRILLCCSSIGSRRCSHKKQDLFIVLDASRNVGIEEFDQARAFLQGFVSRLDVGLGKTHVGLLLADRKQRTKIQISLGQYDSTDTLSRAIGQIKRSGIRKSNMAYALELVQKKVRT